MGKKKAAKGAAGSPHPEPAESPPETGGEQSGDQSPRARAAADAVQRAEAELQRAQELYHAVRQEAADRLKKVRETTLGDLVEGVLATVRKHPGPGVLAALLVGFFCGRLFRR